MSRTRVPLHELAHSRAGDKGNTLNISVILYRAEMYETVARQLTAERVAEAFSFRKPTRVTRYDLPELGAFNFVLENALEGGVNGSLGLDGHGKTLSFAMLQIPVEIGAG
ncbi:AtuA-related protein [Microbaculum marinum]|uniref:AtuA-like ferredoxin-fold domain-containing protein n=1 Tax=Microbaculum marinum TaxID=1764581 RepID=A0AAW9RDF9_9HYPH